MSIINKIKNYLIDIGFNRNISDEKILKKLFKEKMGEELKLEKPKTYNEKIQWLKLYDRKDYYTSIVDKYSAKEYVSNIIGSQYIIPTIGVWDKAKDIDFNILPNQFVLKCTHDSGGIFICTDKEKINYYKIKLKFWLLLKRNFYYRTREWPYKNIEPRIIAEPYLKDNATNELRDYKFFCFDGKVGVVLVCSNRQTNLEETWFDDNFRMLDLTEGGHKNRKDISKPINFNKMKKFAEKLSKGFPHLRVDFYEINGKLYFGELTLYPAGGFEKFEPKEWNDKLGNMIELPKM